ncbi:hypothetical protein GLOIN_2v1783661 [Rhizophagus irregularis DAOM 181602=DAOM 197198]|nr:hypothetical protein GLOIN_2v1783661 [Rhizophagus irregularis DAOM 181602=DAOM 197198]
MTTWLEDVTLAILLIGTDIQQSTTVPNSNNRLLDDYITMPTNDSSFYELEPCLSSPFTTKNWIVTLDEFGFPVFGKQLLVQAGRGTYSIVHWISPNCESLPGDLIKLSPCSGCAAHIPLPPSKKRNADLTLLTSPFTWTDIEDGVRLYYSRLDFASEFSPADIIAALAAVESSAAAIFANSPLVISAESRYIFFTDGSLINLGTPNVFMGCILISDLDLASARDFVLTYDNDVICESNLRHLLKQYYQTQLMRNLLQLTRFHFTSLFLSNIDYLVDWDLTWFALKFKPSHNASFTYEHASRHHTFKFKLFLDELPTLEKLKRT